MATNYAEIAKRSIARMRGQVELPVNGILLVNTPASGTYIDPDSGNERPNSKLSRLLIHSRTAGTLGEPIEQTTPAGEDNRQILQGRFVFPANISPAIPLTDWVDAFVGGIHGKLRINLQARSSWGVEDIIGDRWKGEFVTSSGRYFSLQHTAQYAESFADPCKALGSIPAYRLVSKTQGSNVTASQDLSPYSVIGLSTQASGAGSSIAPMTRGTLENEAWSWTIGAKIYATTSGLTETVPTKGWIWQVAEAITSTSISVFVGFPNA